MSKVRLLRDSGALQVTSQESENFNPDDAPAVLEKDALLCYEGEFASMDGPVTISKEVIRKIIKNHNGFLGKLKRIADDAGLHRYCPPLQLDHETKATHTVGRLAGELYEAPYVRVEDGKTVVGLYGKRVRVLGKENTVKVLDGRWVNLSIGADLETGILSELTITPFPAAPEAKLLSDGNKETNMARPMGLVPFVFTYKGADGGLHKTDEPGTYMVTLDVSGETLRVGEIKGAKDLRDAQSKAKDLIKSFVNSGKAKLSRLGKQKDWSDTYKGVRFEVWEDYEKGTYDLWCDLKQGRTLIFKDKKPTREAFGIKHDVFDAIDKIKPSQRKLSSGGSMFKKLMAFLMFSDKLSKEQALSRLAESSDEDKKKLAEEAEEAEKKLSEEDKEKLKKLKEDEELSEEEDEDKSKLSEEEEEKKKLAAEDEKLRGKLRKKLMEEDKLSEEDADKKLSKMSSEDIKKAIDEHEEKYHKDQKAKLSAANANVSKLSAQLKAKRESARLAATAAKISVRLSSLRADGKITPAEIKKIDIKKLAAGTEAELSAYMKGFEDREPVILSGAFGSSKAVNLAKIEAEKKQARMATEMIGNMPFTRQAIENTAKLSGNTSTLSRLAEEREKNQEDNEHHLSDVPSHKELCALVDGSVTDKEKAEELKKHLGALCKYARASTIDGDKHLAESVDEVQKHLSEIEETTAELEKAVEEVEKLSKQ